LLACDVIYLENDTMKKNVTLKDSVKSRINANGRIVIPAEIRKAMGIMAGDEVVMTFEDGILRVEAQRERIRRVQAGLKKLIPADRVLSDEVIADRREEARQEMEEWLG